MRGADARRGCLTHHSKMLPAANPIVKKKKKKDNSGLSDTIYISFCPLYFEMCRRKQWNGRWKIEAKIDQQRQLCCSRAHPSPSPARHRVEITHLWIGCHGVLKFRLSSRVNSNKHFHQASLLARPLLFLYCLRGKSSAISVAQTSFLLFLPNKSGSAQVWTNRNLRCVLLRFHFLPTININIILFPGWLFPPTLGFGKNWPGSFCFPAHITILAGRQTFRRGPRYPPPWQRE